MPTVRIEENFLAALNGWSDPSLPHSYAWQAADGDPLAGCFQSDNDNGIACVRGLQNWTDWGLPLGAKVTAGRCGFRWKVNQFVSGGPGPFDFGMTAYIDTGNQSYSILDQVTELGVTAPSAWFTVAGGTVQINGATGVTYGMTQAGMLKPTLLAGRVNPLTLLRFIGRIDTVWIELDYDPITPTDILSAGTAGNLLTTILGDDPMICRVALERSWSERVTATGERIWAYQVNRSDCADWLLVSPGLLRDAAAAAGSQSLNQFMGVRVYETVQLNDSTWDANSTGVKIGKNVPVFTFPAWVPMYIPWMGRPVRALIELYTNGGITVNASSVMEVAVTPFVDRAGPS